MSIRLHMNTSLPPSINACYLNNKVMGRRGRTLTEVARNWKLITGYAAKATAISYHWQMPQRNQKIVLEVKAYWPDQRRHDMNNLHKLLCDALEGILYLDDCMVLVRDLDFSVDRKNPRLEITVYEKED